MGNPNREEPKGKAQPVEKDGQDELGEAGGEVQQKAGDQKRQAGEAVEDQRERIRQSQPRQVR
ncbi:hypothetical protein BH20GEM1_BH20GEM1_12890 [soil metagenome]